MILARHIALALMVCAMLAAQAQGVVRWLEQVHDFGTIHEEDGKVSCTMRMVNDGDSSLLITRVRTSCGCTAGEFDRSAVAPGDTASVRVIYNPAARPGQIDKDVFVYTTGNPHRTTISIKGNVIAKPETLSETYPVAAGVLRMTGANIPLGELKRGRTRSSYITTINASSTDTLVARVLNTPPHLLASISPDTLAPGTVGALTVSFDAKKAPLWGLNIDTLTVMSRPLHASATAVSGTTEVFVMAQVLEDTSRLSDKERQNAPSLVTSSDKLMFTADQTTATLIVRNQGKETLELRRMWTQERGVTISSDRTRIKHGKHATISVSIDPASRQPGVLNGYMTLISNDPYRQTVTIRLVGDL